MMACISMDNIYGIRQTFFFYVMDMSGNYSLGAGLLQTLNQESMISIKLPKCTWARIMLLSGFVRIKRLCCSVFDMD
jgi:hypothetical protein